MSTSTRHFVRHYVEMVVAMFAGMAVLGAPIGWALGAVGTSWSELSDTAPSLMLLAMAFTMTVPMVGWMRYRGHGRRANAEMSASMLLPTFALMALQLIGIVEDIGALLVVDHVAMLGLVGGRGARPGRRPGGVAGGSAGVLAAPTGGEQPPRPPRRRRWGAVRDRLTQHPSFPRGPAACGPSSFRNLLPEVVSSR